MAWAGNSIYAIPPGKRKKKRRRGRRQRQDPSNPNKRYCPACGRRAGTADVPRVCRVHGKAGVTRKSFQSHAAWRTQRRKARTAARAPWPVRHKAHLNSKKWARIRQKVIVRDYGMCAGCGQPGLDVHHIHYRTLGVETGDELILLCRPCHEKEHSVGPLSRREGQWQPIIAARIRTRGAVRLERVGASPSTTPGAQVEVPGHQGNQESKPDRTSQPASMVRSRGGVKSPENAMPHQARGKGEPNPGSAGLLVAAYRQSPPAQSCAEGAASGLAMETRTG